MMSINDHIAAVDRDKDSQKAPYIQMSPERRLEVVSQFTDDVLTQLGTAFVEVVKKEHWGKRDLAQISGLHETGIGHILSGRRKNLTIETIALLARAMQKRPQLMLHDVRPKGNNYPSLTLGNQDLGSSAAALSMPYGSAQSHRQRGAATASIGGNERLPASIMASEGQ
jgi:hypothetical protein